MKNIPEGICLSCGNYKEGNWIIAKPNKRSVVVKNICLSKYEPDEIGTCQRWRST